MLGDWGGFGLAAAPLNPKNPPDPRGSCEDEEGPWSSRDFLGGDFRVPLHTQPPAIVPTEPVPPDVTFGVRWDPPEGDRDPQTPPEGDPKTLLVFLFLRHRDPFGGYDTGKGGNPDFGGVPKLWGVSPWACFRGVPQILGVSPRFWGAPPSKLHIPAQPPDLG